MEYEEMIKSCINKAYESILNVLILAESKGLTLQDIIAEFKADIENSRNGN